MRIRTFLLAFALLSTVSLVPVPAAADHGTSECKSLDFDNLAPVKSACIRIDRFDIQQTQPCGVTSQGWTCFLRIDYQVTGWSDTFTPGQVRLWAPGINGEVLCAWPQASLSMLAPGTCTAYGSIYTTLAEWCPGWNAGKEYALGAHAHNVGLQNYANAHAYHRVKVCSGQQAIIT